MHTIKAFVGAAVLGASLAGVASAQSSISDIEARLAAQRQDLGLSRGIGVRTRGIEEVLPSQLRRKPAGSELAAAPADAAAPAAPSAAAPARTEAGTSIAAAAPADPAPTLASHTRLISTRDTDGRPIEVKFFGADSGVDISDPVKFEYNSAYLTPQGRAVLDNYCAGIKASEAANGPAPGGYILIGHADASGDARYNEVLSQKRAEESRRYMADSCGLPLSSLRAVGLGEEALKDPRHPTSAVNRRVELQIGS